jgi:hypothetical protein
VDIETFNLIKKYLANDAGINKVYSGVKTPYSTTDWIIVNPKLGSEGDYLSEKKYFKINSINPNRYTVVLDSTTQETNITNFDVSNVGGITAKILFGRDAETGSQTGPNNSNDSGNKEKGKRYNVDNSGSKGSTSSRTSSKGDVETKKPRDVRNSEYCDSVRKIKKHLKLKVDCKTYQSTLNQIMLALTGGAQIKPVTPVTPVDQPVNNVVQSVPVTDRLF